MYGFAIPGERDDGEVDSVNTTTDEVVQIVWMNREQIKKTVWIEIICGLIGNTSLRKRINSIIGGDIMTTEKMKRLLPSSDEK